MNRLRRRMRIVRRLGRNTAVVCRGLYGKQDDDPAANNNHSCHSTNVHGYKDQSRDCCSFIVASTSSSVSSPQAGPMSVNEESEDANKVVPTLEESSERSADKKKDRKKKKEDRTGSKDSGTSGYRSASVSMLSNLGTLMTFLLVPPVATAATTNDATPANNPDSSSAPLSALYSVTPNDVTNAAAGRHNVRRNRRNKQPKVKKARSVESSSASASSAENSGEALTPAEKPVSGRRGKRGSKRTKQENKPKKQNSAASKSSSSPSSPDSDRKVMMMASPATSEDRAASLSVNSEVLPPIISNDSGNVTTMSVPTEEKSELPKPMILPGWKELFGVPPPPILIKKGPKQGRSNWLNQSAADQRPTRPNKFLYQRQPSNSSSSTFSPLLPTPLLNLRPPSTNLVDVSRPPPSLPSAAATRRPPPPPQKQRQSRFFPSTVGGGRGGFGGGRFCKAVRPPPPKQAPRLDERFEAGIQGFNKHFKDVKSLWDNKTSSHVSEESRNSSPSPVAYNTGKLFDLDLFKAARILAFGKDRVEVSSSAVATNNKLCPPLRESDWRNFEAGLENLMTKISLPVFSRDEKSTNGSDSQKDNHFDSGYDSVTEQRFERNPWPKVTEKKVKDKSAIFSKVLAENEESDEEIIEILGLKSDIVVAEPEKEIAAKVEEILKPLPSYSSFGPLPCQYPSTRVPLPASECGHAPCHAANVAHNLNEERVRSWVRAQQAFQEAHRHLLQPYNLSQSGPVDVMDVFRQMGVKGPSIKAL